MPNLEKHGFFLSLTCFLPCLLAQTTRTFARSIMASVDLSIDQETSLTGLRLFLSSICFKICAVSVKSTLLHILMDLQALIMKGRPNLEALSYRPGRRPFKDERGGVRCMVPILGLRDISARSHSSATKKAVWDFLSSHGLGLIAIGHPTYPYSSLQLSRLHEAKVNISRLPLCGIFLSESLQVETQGTDTRRRSKWTSGRGQLNGDQ